MGLVGLKKQTKNYHRDILGHYATTELAIQDGSPADTFGSWTELIADIGAVPCILLSVNVPITNMGNDDNFSLQIGIGAASSEVAVAEVGQLWVSMSTYEEHSVFPLNVRVPANSRVSARLKSRGTAGEVYANLNYVEA